MKYIFSIVVLAALALVIRKLGLKKIVQAIDKEVIQPFIKEEPAPKPNVENKELDTDKSSLAALETEYKPVLDKIATLKQEQKWGEKDENGFYYSIDKDGVLFSGASSTDEYNEMVQQLKEYTDKKDALTKKIASETVQAQSLELPLELQAILSAIKAKLHLQSADEADSDESDNNESSDNNTDDYGSYDSYGNEGGGGGYFPYQPPVVTPVVAAATPVASPVNPVLNTPVKTATLLHQSFGNLSSVFSGLGSSPTPQLTPTPVPNNTPVINPAQTNTASNARSTNTNHSHGHAHPHGGRRRF